MQTLMLQYGLETMLQIIEDYTDDEELEKLHDNQKLPNVDTASEKGARKRGHGEKTLEKIDQENEAKKFADSGIDKVDTDLS